MTRYAPTRSLVNSTPDFPNGLTVSLGNVGIGTTSPATTLEIAGTGFAGLQMKRRTDSFELSTLSTALYFDSVAAFGIGTVSGTTLSVGGVSAGGTLAVGQTINWSGFSSTVVITGQLTGTAGGNGTYSVTNPSSLSVSSPTQFTGITASGNNYTIRGANGGLEFRSGSAVNVAVGTSRVYFSSAGNVGIGTTGPDAALDVRGKAAFTEIGSYSDTGGQAYRAIGRSTDDFSWAPLIFPYTPRGTTLPDSYLGGMAYQPSSITLYGNDKGDNSATAFNPTTGLVSGTKYTITVVGNTWWSDIGASVYAVGHIFTYNGTTVYPTTNNTGLCKLSPSLSARITILNPSGNVGIGTTAPGALLDIQGSTESLYLLRANGANSNAPNLRIRKSRGTVATKLTVVNGDYLGHITWEGYDGTNFIEGAGIYGISNGTVATGSVPSDLTFYTNPGSMSQGLERMRITAAGKTTIGPLQTGTVSLSLVTPPLSVTAWSYAPYAGFANKIILWDGGSTYASNFFGFGISGSQLDYIAGGAANHVFYINGAGTAASFTGSIPSNSAILTVSAITSGTIAPFQEIVNAAGLPSGLIILDQLTSTETPTTVLGGKGTYTVSSTQSAAVSAISMQTFNARYERMRINNAGVRMTLPTSPTVGQVLAATDTSGTLGWSSGTTYYRQFMFTS